MLIKGNHVNCVGCDQTEIIKFVNLKYFVIIVNLKKSVLSETGFQGHCLYVRTGVKSAGV